jgi:hypothetical protein
MMTPPLTRLLAGLTAIVAMSACRGPREDRIRGWPPSDAERARLAAIAARHAEGADALAAPETEASPSPPDAGDAGADGAAAVLPCAQLVALACELYGSHDDHCREAQARPPDDTHGPTREACAELLGRVQESEVARGTACHRYVKALCAVHGPGSERCVSARSTLALARTRREQRICQGDWLLLEARLFRR